MTRNGSAFHSIDTQYVSLSRKGATLVGETCGKGRDVLLLHAGGESRAVWRPVMSLLVKNGIRAYAFDQRGHGESAGDVAQGIVEFGEDAKLMIKTLRKPVVVGGSLGGFALMLALEQLETDVTGLVLVDVTPAPDPKKTRAYLSPRGDLGGSPLIEDILSKSERFERIVGGLKLPILLVCGGERSPLRNADRKRFEFLAQHAHIETIPYASHLVARDAPLKLGRLINQFTNLIDVAR